MEKNESPQLEPSLPELCRALQVAAQDLFSFACIIAGDDVRAEAYLLDTLLEALEHRWFAFSFQHNNEFTYLEFKEHVFRTLWLRIHQDKLKKTVAGIAPLGESDMDFYRLPILQRAALYLRSKMRFNYTEIQFILGLDEVEQVEATLEKARNTILGRQIAVVTAHEVEH